MNNTITVTINLDKIELPDYEFSVNDLMEETGATMEEVCKKLNINMDADNFDPDETMRQVVEAEKVVDFKNKLLVEIREDIITMIEDYKSGETDEPALDDTIIDIGEEFYTGDCDDLADEINYQVEIKVT
jgi:predicted component of type VI protein secretion system